MTTDQLVSFRERFRDALERGAEYEALREMVRHYYTLGGEKKEAYDALQEIWLEYGYDDNEHEQPDRKRDDLEAVMERVWYWGI